MLIENNRDKNSLRLKSVERFNQQRLKSKSLVDWNTMWLKSVEILGQCRWCPTPPLAVAQRLKIHGFLFFCVFVLRRTSLCRAFLATVLWKLHFFVILEHCYLVFLVMIWRDENRKRLDFNIEENCSWKKTRDCGLHSELNHLKNTKSKLWDQNVISFKIQALITER